MDDIALAAHRLDELFGPEIGGMINVGAQTKRGVGRILRAACQSNGGDSRAFQLRQGRIEAYGVARENAEAFVTLGDETLDQFGLKTQFPIGRNFEIDRSDSEILLGVGGGLFPRLEIRVRAAGNQGNLVVRGGGRSSAKNQPEKRG